MKLTDMNIKNLKDCVWELPLNIHQGINISGKIYASESLLQGMGQGVLKQISNIASLPGIVNGAYCMPDGHLGYGFPIGGVVAVDPKIGIISPGGIGFDINCGMRLVSTNISYDEIKPKINQIMNNLFKSIPCGVGNNGIMSLSRTKFQDLLQQGAKGLVLKGYGYKEDLETTEDSGCIQGADVSKVSKKAIERGRKQVGSLGSGNHYLEIQIVRSNDISDKPLAQKLGIKEHNQVMIMFHCGSRGFGHQIATDYSKYFLKIMKGKYHIDPLNRELSCVPFKSEDGQDYFAAMKCAANMAYANRQVILYKIREVFSDLFLKTPRELGLYQIVDVCHNIARLETHLINGRPKKLLLHRKGATRAFGPNAIGISKKYKGIGEPVIIGGSMETGSYLLVGTDVGTETFYSTAHGSGRRMSRSKAKKKFNGKNIYHRMYQKGICIKTKSFTNLAEEAGNAYNDIDEIVKVLGLTGISKPVARLRPIGNIKG